MPYIKVPDRKILNKLLAPLKISSLKQGELAYLIYKVAFRDRPYSYEGLSLARAVVRDVLDVLTKELLEYEDEKRSENGAIHDKGN